MYNTERIFPDGDQPINTHLKYRPEIDGLRALAIILVVFYHAQILIFDRNYFLGGFIGVDVFFVLSGYLISRVIFSEIDLTDKFSLKNFYIRRARRILPMLFVVIIVSSPLAFAILEPKHLMEFSQSALSAIFSISNIYFYFSTTEYGAVDSLLKPLLNTWSLGVEEQFYLVFPITLLLLKTKVRIFSSLVCVFAISLGLSIYYSTENKDLAFYILPTRAWELLAGVFVCLFERQKKYNILMGKRWDVVCAAAVGGIVCSAVIFFRSYTNHPGMMTLLPVLCTVMLLIFLPYANKIRPLFEVKAFRAIGKLSYSFYLWHFPILAFGRYYLYPVYQWQVVALILVSLLLSWTSFNILENPIRRIRSNRMFFWLLTLLFLTSVTAAMIGLWNQSGSMKSKTIDEVKVSSFITDDMIERPRQSVDFESLNEKPIILFIGDSHVEPWGALSSFVKSDYQVVSLSYLRCEFNYASGDTMHLKSVNGAQYAPTCGALDNFLRRPDLLTRVAAIFLMSHRPLTYSDNTFRFDLIKTISLSSTLSPQIFVFGNYFQLSPMFIGCSKLMERKTTSSAEVCIDYADNFNPVVQLNELRLYREKIDAIDGQYIDLFGLLKSASNSYPAEYKSVPFMYDWNHLTPEFIFYIGERLVSYQGSDGATNNLRTFLN